MRWLIVLLSLSTLLAADPWGKDADLCHPRCSPISTETRSGPMEAFAEIMIGFHQNIISPADGPRSHYKPSSSQYTLDAIRRYGFFQGYFLGCDRLMRENNDPWVYRTIETDDHLITKFDPVR